MPVCLDQKLQYTSIYVCRLFDLSFMIYLGNSVDDAQRPPEPEMSSDTSRDVLSRGLEMERREVFVLELQTNHRQSFHNHGEGPY